MLSFSMFRKVRQIMENSSEHKGITYIPVYPDDESVRRLMNLQHDLEISNPDKPESLHCTLAYSRTPVNLPSEDIITKFLPAPAQGCRLRQFDYSTLGTKCLVLELKSIPLVVIHNELKKYGASHDYPDFIAHVTLVKDLKDQVNMNFAVDDIELNFDRYEIKRYD